MKDSILTSINMAIITAVGWKISMQDIEQYAKIVSLIVPPTLSLVMFLRNIKKQKNEKKDS